MRSPSISRPLHRAALGLLALLAGCTTSAEPRCASDDDCRPGFTCDLERFVGECVQIVEVEPCGADLCTLPQTRCVDGRCQAVSLPPDAGVSLDGGAHDMGGIIEVADADPGPPPPPTLLITQPTADARLVDVRPVLTGEVGDLVRSGRVYFVLDDGAVSGDLSPVDGRFEVALDLPLGHHQITVVAEQGEHRVEATVGFTLNGRVLRQGNRLILGDRPFRFMGMSAPLLYEAAWRQAAEGDAAALAQTFDAAARLGLPAIRARAFDDRPEAATVLQRRPGSLAPEGLAALDQLIAEAEARGVKLWLTLGCYDCAYGGVDQYLRWAGYAVPRVPDYTAFFEPGDLREAFKGYITSLLDRTNSLTGVRYGDDPTIMGWEILEGLSAEGVFDGAGGGAEMVDFVVDVAGLIQDLAPDQLVAAGGDGFDVEAQPYGDLADDLTAAGLASLLDGTYGVSWRRHVGLAPISLAGIHLRPDALGLPANDAGETLGSRWISGHRRVAVQAGRPSVVLTLTAPAWGGLSVERRRVMMEAWLDEIALGDWSGVFAGSFYPEGEGESDPARWGVLPGAPLEDPANIYADLIQAAAEELGR